MYIIPERKAPPTTVFNLYSKPMEKVRKNLRNRPGPVERERT